MQSKGFYGVVVVLVALLLVVSSFAAFYYYQNKQTSADNEQYVSELDSALADYRSLAASYNTSLADYNQTLTLLANAVANLNTSTPAYQEASAALSSLWASYLALAKKVGAHAIAFEVNMLVDFGNGTTRWYNDTSVEPGWNGYIATLVLLNGSVQATWYPTYGEHLVTGLLGVSDNSTDDWFLLTYNSTASWQVSLVGADDIPMLNGTTFAWQYCPENSNYLPACPPP